MNIILFDEPATKVALLPFTYLRPIAQIRVGILTILEKWKRWMTADYSYLSEQYLQQKFTQRRAKDNLYINGSFLPNATLVDQIAGLQSDQLLMYDGKPVAFYGDIDDMIELTTGLLQKDREMLEFQHMCISIANIYDIFIHNRQALIEDFRLVTSQRQSAPVNDRHTVVYHPERIFIEEGAKIKAAVLNAETGPIYIGRGAHIGEGSIVRGATAICESATLNLGTKIRGDSTIGPFSKVGGEISNSVIFGYSSKGHDGYLGNSVIGEWCNIGADSNTSNLKNNYANVRIWNYAEERFVDSGRQFCGLMMGDHAKCGINTMFNTGTVVGVCANIFGSGFPRAFVPSFAWGGAAGFTTFQFQKALEVMGKVLERRKKTLSEADVSILQHIFEASKKYRKA